MKEESIAQLREQVRRCEVSFKEEAERIRQDCMDRVNSHSTKPSQIGSESKASAFKTAVQ